jgi:hypothetical protein
MEIDDYGAMSCPRCGNLYTHQKTVEVFFGKEDSETGVRCLADDTGGVKVDRESKRQPARDRRRDAIYITFWCEECKGTTRLSIIQHKGQTLFETS